MGAFAAFRHRGYVLYQAGRLVFVVATQMLGVSVAIQVYDLTGRKLSLGLVGLAQFLPAFLLVFVSGNAADRFDRRRLVIAGAATQACCALALMLLSRDARPGVWLIYGALAVAGTGRAFSGPAGSALMPTLLPTEALPNGVAWSSTIWQIATVAGPPLGGLIYALTKSPSTVYAICIALELVAMLLYALIPPPTVVRRREPLTLETVLGGVRYLRENRIVLGAISLDLFAVLLGGAVALLPVYAKNILHVDETGLGWLRAGPAIGATATALVLARLPITKRAGRLMLGCVAVFGAATVVFGLSHEFSLSMLALIVTGASDMVSVFVRQTLVQVLTPDAMRGRVSAVNQVFVGASNELGEFESGVTGEWLGAERAVVLGGAGTLLVVVLWAWLFPALRDVDRLEPTHV